MTSFYEGAPSPRRANPTYPPTYPDERKLQAYSSLFTILHSSPRRIATLCTLVSLTELDTLLQTIMFTLYNNDTRNPIQATTEDRLILSAFRFVLSAHFDEANEFGSLLRANTPVSRMLTSYTRRAPGQDYLRRLLASPLSRLLERSDLNLEINPVKVYGEMIDAMERNTGHPPVHLPLNVSAEEAQVNLDVEALITPRIVKLVEIADNLLSRIIDSVEVIPYGIRLICRQIRALTKSKDHLASEDNICSLIGGFFFLRYVNPAIVSPEAHKILKQAPGKYPRRTLTLLAKMLQNLANRPSNSSEAYMTALDPFIEKNKKRVTKFMEDICRVPPPQASSFPASDVRVAIKVNDLYQTHLLIARHAPDLSFPEERPLRGLLDELGSVPDPVPSSANHVYELRLYGH
ncbi:Rho GTPase activation protein [Amylostereum chailletii]|nr:Rho GTPase activation protein [Amylostereum chailletii]